MREGSCLTQMDRDELRARVFRELASLGFEFGLRELKLTGGGKGFYQELHATATMLELKRRQNWLKAALPRYLPFFADGHEVDAASIRPALVEVCAAQQHELFRVARLTWSLPYSKGFGRRLRFLVMDEHNGKLIGILALQSPPLSFPARDRVINYPEGRKIELVNQTMDIHTLGAVPPYAQLLGGKLVALAAVSNEVRAAYRRKYQGRITEMEGRLLPPHLVALTTTSAFGRSSLYNRLRCNGTVIAESLGYTDGYGSFHLMELYPLFREFLEAGAVSTRGGFGSGPRRKWQTMVRALERLGLPPDLLRHGVRREAFLFPLATNLMDYMEGRTAEPAYRDLPFVDLAAYWRERWLLPRAQRVVGWQGWQREKIAEILILPQLQAEKTNDR